MMCIVSRLSAVAASPKKDVNVAPSAVSAARTARLNGGQRGKGGLGQEPVKARYTSRSTSMQSWKSSDNGQYAGFEFGRSLLWKELYNLRLATVSLFSFSRVTADGCKFCELLLLNSEASY